jgi:hypothetical protein
MTDVTTPNKEVKTSTKITHVIHIDGESFPVYHLERRLYKFEDWKDAREKLIKIILRKVKEVTGVEDAYIEFQMANPMRKSRLGNFFIDIKANILYNHKSLGTVEELGVKQIFADSFDNMDEEEMSLRSNVENKHSIKQYNEELSMRVSSLRSIYANSCSPIYGVVPMTDSAIEGIAEDLMHKEGWSKTQDNRLHARMKRLSM